MKKIISFAVTLVIALTSLNSIAAERSMTLYKDANFQGAYADIHDEVFLGVALSSTSNGVTRAISHLGPVGENATSSIEVMEGYCAVLASGTFLAGSWKTLKPGRYSTLGDFDNKTRSVLVYKMIGEQQTACNPLKDIPVLFDGKYQTGQAFPVTINNGYNAQADSPFNQSIFPGFTMLWAYHVSYGSYSQAAGGFLDKASSMSVPACYEIRTEGKVFGRGNYNLATYGLDNQLSAVTVVRQDNCIQPRPVTTQPPVNPDCGPNHLKPYNGGQLVHVTPPNYSFPISSINAFCGSCGFRVQPISYYPGANLVFCK